MSAEFEKAVVERASPAEVERVVRRARRVAATPELDVQHSSVVRVGDSLTSPVNLAAAAAGVERSIAGWVPHFSAIAPILAGSDLLATLPAIAMAETLHPYRLESREVPFPMAPLPHALVWSSRRSADPEMTWLRDRLRPIVKAKFTDLAG